MANVEISILGQQYKIACPDGKEETLQETVAQFNNILKEIKSSSRTLRNEQLIVMAALNVCHELQTEKSTNEKQTEKLNERIQYLQDSIEKALQPTYK
ncbi:cell division protein ZapA [Psychromonas sp. PT13]|uniref:cell division protein ZapA n=1 Tax=Psychromonas sp. PT13 TaxID=3439547 RepID=UPI003EB8F4EE